MIVAPTPASANCARKERTRQARIGAGRVQLHIAAGVIGMEAGVDDELNRLVSDELADRRDHFVRQLARAGIHHQRALIADLHGDIAAVADQHIDIALHRQHMDFAVVRIGVDGAAGSAADPWKEPAQPSRQPPRRRRSLASPRIAGTWFRRRPEPPTAGPCAFRKIRADTDAGRTSNSAPDRRAGR